MPTRLPLPIDSVLAEITQVLRTKPSLILNAAPGSGKTTRVPVSLLESKVLPPGKILILEPRRLAAKFAARRVASELGEKVGERVGYHFRFERVVGKNNQILFLTEGMLLRYLIQDPLLSGVSAVLMDEFHERHLHSDVALSYLRSLQNGARPELRLVVMSATLDTSRLSEFLEGSAVVECATRAHEVAIHYMPGDGKPLDGQVKLAVSRALNDIPEGDCLVFLPGMGDIRRSEMALSILARERGWEVLALHGELSREEQDRAVRPGARRRIILSTNVAESSLTIEGLRIVIDSGLHRQASYSGWTGIPSLKTRTISRASATQRAGRAGRTAPGSCFRLYHRSDFEGSAPFETPEIQRGDLTQVLLELSALGVRNASSFPWFEPPSQASIDSASKLLERLGAVQASGELTERGRRMAALPTHPRLARLLLEGEALGVAGSASTLAALIQEGELESLNALELPRHLGERTQKAKRQFQGALESGADSARNVSEALALSALAGFPDRIGRKRASQTARVRSDETEIIFSQGGSARIRDEGVVAESDFFVLLDVQERKAQHQTKSYVSIHSLIPISMESLAAVEPSPLETSKELKWDSSRKQVMESELLKCGQIIIEETSRPAAASADATSLLLKECLRVEMSALALLPTKGWVALLGANGEAIEKALARYELACRFAKTPLPDASSAPLLPHLLPLMEGMTRQAQLEDLDWGGLVLKALAGERAGWVLGSLPSHATLAKGRRVEIHYEPGKPPWLESRLQDFFGMRTGPTLFDGKLAITLHLLAPNKRAVQVTSDLAGFWTRSYPTIRKELSRRYPRHPWPENPLGDAL